MTETVIITVSVMKELNELKHEAEFLYVIRRS